MSNEMSPSPSSSFIFSLMSPQTMWSPMFILYVWQASFIMSFAHITLAPAAIAPMSKPPAPENTDTVRMSF